MNESYYGKVKLKRGNKKMKVENQEEKMLNRTLVSKVSQVLKDERQFLKMNA